MSKDCDFSYINENGKVVSGAAAFNHYVYTEKGSIRNYNDEVGEEYIKAFIKENSDIINSELSKKVRKSRLKAV